MIKKKNKPKFNVPNLGFMTSIRSRWRKPRGTGNKKRRKCRWAGKSPRIGYKNAADVRGLHPLGMPEILVSNLNQLKNVTNKVVRIASQVGGRKALEIEKAARSAGLTVLNSKKAENKALAAAQKIPPINPEPSSAPQMKGGSI